jgi:hypothetical protein
MTVTSHIATDDITQLQVVIGNWYWDLQQTAPKQEKGSGNSGTIKLSLEYPAGTFTVFQWSSTGTVTIASGNNAITDLLTGLSIPRGARFWLREYATWAGGLLPYISSFGIAGGNLACTDSTNGEAMKYTSATDQTTSGTVTATVAGDTGPIRRPLAIIANTSADSVGIVADSIGWRDYDMLDGAHGFGRFLSALGNPIGFINMAGDGELVKDAKSNYALRGALLQYVGGVWFEPGVNDLTFAVNPSGTAAQLITDISGSGGLLSTYAPNLPVMVTTLLPPVASSDSWATLANQTPDGLNAQLESYNTTVRSIPPWAAGCIDLAALLESGTTGKRIVNGTANFYQADTIHPSLNAIRKVRNNALVDQYTFSRTGATAAAAMNDNFNDNSMDVTKWVVGQFYSIGATTASVTVAESSGTLRITGPASDATLRCSGYVGKNFEKLNGGNRFVALSNALQSTDQAIFGLGKDINNNYHIIVDTANGIRLRRVTNGSGSVLSTVAYGGTTSDRWFRIRFDMTNDLVLVDTAPSSASNPPASGDWVNKISVAQNLAINPAVMKPFLNGYFGGSQASPTTFVFDGYSMAA